jgi:hypothetical protein
VIKPETKRLKQLVAEWKKIGLSGGYESGAGSVHLSTEHLEEAEVDLEQALHKAREMLDAGARPHRVTDVLSAPYMKLKTVIERANTTQSARGDNLARSIPSHNYGGRVQDLVKAHEDEIARAKALSKKTFEVLWNQHKEPEKFRAALDAAVPACHVSMPPGTTRG